MIALAKAKFLWKRPLPHSAPVHPLAYLNQAKDGEGRASEVEPIFGDLIKSLHMKALTKLLAKMPAGRGERKPIY